MKRIAIAVALVAATAAFGQGWSPPPSSSPHSAGNSPVVVAVNPDGTKIGTAVPSGAAHYANGHVTTSTSAATFVVARPTRKGCLLINTDSSITVYYGAPTVTAGNGIPLKAGQSVVINTTGLIQVIAASGSPVVAFYDEYD